MKRSLVVAALVVLLIVCATAAAGAASLEVRNHTGFFINIYVDDVFMGTIRPNSYAVIEVSYGSLTLYARAPYTSTTWGPTDIYDNGYYTWNLWD
jgi:hypothetical protein